MGTPVDTLPGDWRYWVSAVSVYFDWVRSETVELICGEVDSLICNFCLSVAARTPV